MDEKEKKIESKSENEVNERFPQEKPQNDSARAFDGEKGYKRDGKYLYFGEYPQTVKAETVEVSDQSDERGYYLGSDGFYYAKVTANPKKDIRAISKEIVAIKGSNANRIQWKTEEIVYSFSTGERIASGAAYYFKVEPIRWRILEEREDQTLLFCECILANRGFFGDLDNRTIEGKNVYPNNYEASDIRAWLNETFFAAAFNDLQKERILLSALENGAESMNPFGNAKQWSSCKNQYAGDRTEDKVFLLGEQEVTNPAFGFKSDFDKSDKARRKKGTDFAMAQGLWTSTYSSFAGLGAWWLRSPSFFNSRQARVADTAGSTADCRDVNGADLGVVPALRIRL